MKQKSTMDELDRPNLIFTITYSQSDYCFEYVPYKVLAIFRLVLCNRISLQYTSYADPYSHVNTLEYVLFDAVIAKLIMVQLTTE